MVVTVKTRWLPAASVTVTVPRGVRVRSAARKNLAGRASAIGGDYTWTWDSTELLGLPASLIDQATLRLRIDMSPGVDSLNVGVAGAIALFLLRSAREQGQ